MEVFSALLRGEAQIVGGNLELAYYIGFPHNRERESVTGY